MKMEKIEAFFDNRAVEELYFIVISLVLAFGILQTTGAVLNTDKPVVSVVSCSMYPQLHVGDILVVQGQNFEDIKEGDVLVYSTKQAEISVNGQSHRVTNYGQPEPVETSAGELSLLNVENTDGGGSPETAIIRFNGDKYRIEQDRTYQIGGASLTVESVDGVSIPIVHRVIEKNQDYLETKGDNNNQQLSFETNVTPEQVHGTSLFVIPRIGGLKLLVMDLVGFNGDQPFVVDSYPSCTERA
ncbi:signal peptidase I [Candidatus Nanohalococcus occultus]